MNAVTIVILIFSLLGALDLILGNRFGLGKEFERGFELFGPLALSMIGMLIIAPAAGEWLSPVFDTFYSVFRLDPSVIPASIFANDMGGAALALEAAKDDAVGRYNAYVVSSMMGCVISFTIPFAAGTVSPTQHRELFFGMLCGIVTIPIGCFIAGLLCGLPLIRIVVNLLPLIILSALIAAGIIFIPEICVKIFRVFGMVMKIIITLGLAAGIFTFLTNITVIENFDTFESGAMVCVNACVTLSGAFPLMYVVGKLLKKPMTALGAKLGVNTASVLGFVPTLVNNATTFGMMRDMDKKGVVLNSAFAVSAAFVFGDHLAFTMAFDTAYIAPMIAGKLIGGISAVVLAMVVYREKTA
nr:ethanolamine utilization protein EutH [Clostridia bacterium]